jgi:glycosyltransferase involved in cell wall biosynthesis
MAAPTLARSVPLDRAVGDPRPLRIAMMLESDGPGGAEVLVIRLCEELRSRGHFVLPVGPARGVGWLGTKLRERGFTPATFQLRRAVDFGAIGRFAGLFRDNAIDVVHSHEFTMAVYGTAAARRVGIPHIISMHGNQGMTKALRRRIALRWAFARATATVAVSSATRASLAADLGLQPARFGVVLNGVPPQPGNGAKIRRELGIGTDDLVVVAVGNLDHRKGHLLLLQAMAALEEGGLPATCHVVIAGGRGGDQHELLLAFAREHGFAERVHILLRRDDVADILAAADVFAMPSLWEGLPLALLEAMLAGKPVVSSVHSGIPEAVTSGRDGLLVPAGDVPALSEALGRLLTDSGLRQQLASAALARAEREFTIARMTDRYEALYNAGLAR